MRGGFLLGWSLILFGAIEAIWGLLQVYGYEPSNHSLYALTGSFYNPGPYSGFLAMCLPLALHEWLEGKRIWKHLALVAWVLMLVVLPSGMSRSAWLAALVASGYVLGMHYRDRLYRFLKFFWIGGLLLILLGVGAYHWKKDSADGRLLMWKVAIQAVLEYPWQGVGWENVAGAYGDAQERYFASGVASEQEVHVAGAPEYVFNEYLQVAMAWGVPALCGILLLVGGCFCLGHRGRMFGVCGALLSLSVFSFSSYPFQFLEFIVAFGALLVACLIRLRNVYLQVAVLIIGIGVCLYLYDYREEHPMRKAHTMFNRAHSLHKAGEWEASTEILKETMRISSDAMILNIIGKNCQALGELQRSGGMVYPFHSSVAEPYLSLLSVGQTVCGASQVLPKREIGVGGADGIGEGSEGGIDCY